MEVWRGGDKVKLHIKDKFWDDAKIGKMGSWGIIYIGEANKREMLA